MPVETALTEQTRSFKSIDFGTPNALEDGRTKSTAGQIDWRLHGRGVLVSAGSFEPLSRIARRISWQFLTTVRADFSVEDY